MERARRAMLFREVNDRIGELLAQAGWGVEGDFLCECGREECGRRATLSLHEYEAHRRRGEAILSNDCRRGMSRPCRQARARSGRLAAST